MLLLLAGLFAGKWFSLLDKLIMSKKAKQETVCSLPWAAPPAHTVAATMTLLPPARR